MTRTYVLTIQVVLMLIHRLHLQIFGGGGGGGGTSYNLTPFHPTLTMASSNHYLGRMKCMSLFLASHNYAPAILYSFEEKEEGGSWVPHVRRRTYPFGYAILILSTSIDFYPQGQPRNFLFRGNMPVLNGSFAYSAIMASMKDVAMANNLSLPSNFSLVDVR